MDAHPTRPAVLLLHGLWMNRLVMSWLARRLQREGFATRCVGYRSLRAGLGEHVASVRRQIASLAAPNDGVVAVAETQLPWLDDHLVLAVSHSGMLFSRQVARQTAAFLRQGSFER